MRFCYAVILLIAFMAMNAGAQRYESTPPQYDDSLGGGLGWMNIVSPEHTAEYLAKTGGATGSATTYTSIDIRGNWSFELRTLDDKMVGTVNLNLAQIGTVVFGAGTVRGSNAIVTANGAIVDNMLTLNIVTYPNVELYSARLNQIGGGGRSAAGYFDAYSSSGGSLQGTIRGEKDVPRTLS
ncbi:MAG: hypothetical protein H5T42_04720 [Methanothrix sp.]|jgi:hypothetical protein|uniref:Uncharacterized protein n=1 Tax=Methanothrix thermoacetophila (strain DSM 6194 / JCM 14653 / NBRC 101360 / PT) TaxID=349307 RepID=A0B618_METTP|nr:MULTISPECIES: hypothetical protein [Methanothrix]ABK14142.1 hypothetical protein Mthe_0349 [Methanothrix thermoacetophila PT]MBC7079758.1 hypothetical protein [Methanothrix sp.]NPU87834.1 hypothetical protein [Methanothrix sp.]